MRVLALILMLCAPGIVAAQDTLQDIEAEALAASQRLIEAGDLLEAATLARDRVAALTQTVHAYESGLMSLRAGLRQVTLRERNMTRRFERRRDEIAGLLAVLSAMERAPAPMLLLHPAGPIGTARAGQMIAEITPAMRAEAEALRFDLETLAELRTLQETSVVALEQGLEGVQNARISLGAALAERRALPRRFVNDGAAMSALVQNADTLDSFAVGLSELPAGDPIAASAPTDLDLPVAGQVIRGFQERDAAGIRRPGWVVATPPGALVGAPLTGTLRYAGPLLDYGNVIILEPGQGEMLVLAGMQEVYGEPGDVIAPGAPLGVMGGALPTAEDFLTEMDRGAGIGRTETLYIEVRQANGPVDPSVWFAHRQR